MFTGNIYDEGAPLRVAFAYQQVSKWLENSKIGE